MKDQVSFRSQVPLQIGWLKGPFEVFLEGRTAREPALVVTSNDWREQEISSEAFLTFAHIDPQSDDDIAQFASSHGLLGGGPRIGIATSRETSVDGPGIKGELRSYWRGHIREMKEAVDLWDDIQAKDETALKNRIQWRSPTLITYEGEERVAPLSGMRFHNSTIIALNTAERRHHPELIERLRPGDLLTPARIHLIQTINEKLRPYVEFGLRLADDFKHVVTINQPVCLVGALWFQIAMAVQDFASFRTCDNCGKWLRVLPGGYRINRRTCNDRCRVQFYDRRKAAARKLYAAGTSVEEIAKRLDYQDRKQIEIWIKPAASKQKEQARASK